MPSGTETKPQEDIFEPITVGDSLEDMIGPLRHTLEQGEKRVEVLKERFREALARQQQENAKARRALASIDPEYVHPSSNKNSKRRRSTPPPSNGTGFGVSVEVASRHAVHVLEIGKDGAFFTQGDLIREPWTNQAKTSAVFKFFREIEFIRDAGRKGGRNQYAILDKDAFKNWLANKEDSDG